MTSLDILEEAIMNLEGSVKTLDFQLHDRAARTNSGQGGNVCCHTCQQTGHSKEQCTVPKDKLFCKWCGKKEHNSNSYCKRQMDKKKKDKKGTEQNRSTSKDRKNEQARKSSTKRDSTPCRIEEEDLNGDDGQRVTVLDSQSEDEDDLEDDFTPNGSRITQYDTDENYTDTYVTPHEEQVEQETPPLMDDKDSEDDLNEDSIDLERLIDDLTINDIGEREKPR